MPRNPENRRVEILLSPDQFAKLKEYVQYEYLGVDPNPDAELPNGAMAAAIRQILETTIPSFGEAHPLVERGKYDREKLYDGMTEALIEAYQENEWMTMDGFYPPEDDEFDDDEDESQ